MGNQETEGDKKKLSCLLMVDIYHIIQSKKNE